MKQSQPKYGAIHTDGPSKVMTMLVYMNDDWQQDEGGRLRVLYDEKNYEPLPAEVPPNMGTMFAFLRSDNSWHGHRPFTGERRVVQVAWVKSQADARAQEEAQQHGPVLQGHLRAVSVWLHEMAVRPGHMRSLTLTFTSLWEE